MFAKGPQINQLAQEQESEARLPRKRQPIRNLFRKVLRRDLPSRKMITCVKNRFKYGCYVEKGKLPYIRTDLVDLSEVKLSIKNEQGDGIILTQKELAGERSYNGWGKVKVTDNGNGFKTYSFQPEKNFQGKVTLTIPSLGKEVVFNIKQDDSWQESIDLPKPIERFKEFDLLASGGVALKDIKGNHPIYFDRAKLNLSSELSELNPSQYSKTFLDIMSMTLPTGHDYRANLSTTAHETLHGIASKVSDYNELNRVGVTFNEDGTTMEAKHNRSFAIILPSKKIGMVCEHPPAFVGGELFLDKVIREYPMKDSMSKSFKAYADSPLFTAKKHKAGFLLEELNACIVGNRVARETMDALVENGLELSNDPAKARLQAYKIFVKGMDSLDDNIDKASGHDTSASVVELAIGVVGMAKILKEEDSRFYEQSGYQQVVDELCSIAIEEFKFSEDLVLRNGYEELRGDNPLRVEEYLTEIKSSENCQELREFIKQNLPKVSKELELK